LQVKGGRNWIRARTTTLVGYFLWLIWWTPPHQRICQTGLSFWGAGQFISSHLAMSFQQIWYFMLLTMLPLCALRKRVRIKVL
jgi:hypothetical protein